ncbi:TetR family transcriptional regulator [Dictyobacter sp. S3.2.2.5]|uniref:TetR family transcriptional regulator n=1 Tax=Dictyobacter halimunensis TaxID=3026934 RepID=A0ABQ6G7L3_9CHLR|nr:TetR family transcriptional regulator [Dictyobacter sp. S3.2.2.5]
MNDIVDSQDSLGRQPGLRERKKRLAQATIEETALRLFQQRGYEQTSIQDIADAVMMSPRTFFRYFASKEELLFAPTQTILEEGASYLRHVAAAKSAPGALIETLEHLAGLYQQQKAGFLLRYHIATVTPSLIPGYLYSLAVTEPAFCEALAARTGSEAGQDYLRFLVAVSMAAFRAALTVWFEHDASTDLVSLLREHLAYFSSLAREVS